MINVTIPFTIHLNKDILSLFLRKKENNILDL